MTDFWTISLFWALFAFFIGVALAFVLPPLLRRTAQSSGQVDRKEANIAIYHDQMADLKSDLNSGELDAAQYEDAKREIEKRLSEDVPLESASVATAQPGRWPGYVLAGAIPVLAVAIYMVLGSPDALVASRTETPAMVDGKHDPAPMIAALEAKLKKKPDDAAGWYMLARSYGSLGRYDDAARAFAKLTELVPEDSSILAAYADVLAMTQGGNLQGKPLELINKALKLNDKDELALNLAGTAAYKAKDFAQAAAYWRRLLQAIPADADYAKEIRGAVDQAEKAAGIPSGAGDSTKPSAKNGGVEKAGKGGAASVSGTVTVAREIAAKVSQTDTVFIFAQLPKGPKMPLASLKIGAGQLPYRFTLDDSLAMTPGDSLSRHPEIVVTARISKTGEAMPHGGDLQGKTGTVKPGQQGLDIVIDTVLP